MAQVHDVVLIGAGRMGQIHGPNAARHPGLRLRYIVETDAQLAAQLAESLGAEIVSLEHALADPAIKGAIVASSTDRTWPSRWRPASASIPSPPVRR